MTNETKSPAQYAPVVAASELSDEQIDKIVSEVGNKWASVGGMSRFGGRAFARAVLAAATPAASVAQPIGVVGPMPGASGFTIACFEASKVPVGTNLYAGPSPAVQQPAEGGWISVHDDRPTGAEKKYWVASNWGVRVAHLHPPEWAKGEFQDALSGSDEGMYDWDHSKGPFTVTHWQEIVLPAAPTQAEE